MSSTEEDNGSQNVRTVDNHGMRIFAHRGSSLVWPENTLEAFRRAHEAGATGFETDLRLSRDGRIVLCHDADLARLGRPGVRVEELEARELTGIEVPSPDGSLSDTMITLRTLLEAYPAKDYILDCKVSDPALFAALETILLEARVEGTVWFLAWSREAERRIERIFPDRPLFPSYRRSTIWGLASVVGLGRIAEPPNRILSLPARQRGLSVFGRAQIASIRRRGKTFMGYLVNTTRDLERCIDCGVDVFLTDRPDVVGPRCSIPAGDIQS
jgi:glycerophosphoryl diester phosphodiesterase